MKSMVETSELFESPSVLVHLHENNPRFFGDHVILLCQLLIFVGIFPQQIIMSEGGLELQTDAT